MTELEGWVCKVCWKLNRPRDEVCWKCKTPSGVVDEETVEAERKALAARAALPEPVPDLVVALPVVIFRGYGKAWFRGGLGLVGFLALMAFGGVTDLVWYGLTAGFAGGLILGGLLSGEVAEGMRNREAWAFLTGIVLAGVGVVGSVTAFEVLAPGLVNPNAVRWGSVLVFGGAGIAALVGLVMLFTHHRRMRAGDSPATDS